MKGLGRGPYARVLIFLIPSFGIAFLVKRDRPTSLCLGAQAPWHTRGKAASSTCGLARRGGEAKGDEARSGTLIRTKGKMSVKKGWHACSD